MNIKESLKSLKITIVFHYFPIVTLTLTLTLTGLFVSLSRHSVTVVTARTVLR